MSAAVGLCALLACELENGGGGNGGTVPETTVELLSTAVLDGWARIDASATAGAAITGDLDAVSSAAGKGYRQFYTFALGSLPAGATVTSATLQLYQVMVNGSPYAELGSVVVDHLDYGPSLEAADYNATPLTPSVGILSNDVAPGYKTLVVTALVQADLAASRTRSQFRIRFSNADSNNDGTNDHAEFAQAESPNAGNVPKLVVKYR